MSHPGTGPDITPSGQQPGQPGQPYQPFDQQPGQPAGAWTPPQGGASPFGEPQKKSGLKKVLPVVGGLAVAGALAFGGVGGLFGLGDPAWGTASRAPGRRTSRRSNATPTRPRPR